MNLRGRRDAGRRELDATSGPANAVRGHVAGGRIARPGLVVRAGAALAVTDLDGAFELDGLAGTYDLTVSDPATNAVWVFEGLSRRDPTLHIGVSAPRDFVELNGKLGGIQFPTAPSTAGCVAFVTSTFASSNLATAGVGSAFGSAPPLWNEDHVITGTVRALVWTEDAYGGPSGFLGYGATRDVVNVDGGGSAPVVLLAPVGSHTYSVNFTFAPGLTVAPPYTLLLRSPDEAPWVVFEYNPSPPLPLSLVFPDAPDAQAAVIVGARDVDLSLTRSTARMILLNGSEGDVSVELPSPVELLGPPDAAHGTLDGTEFSWTAAEGTIYEFTLASPQAAGFVTSVHVVTALPRARLPDLSAIGMALTDPTIWSVSTYGPAASIDDASGPDPMFRFNLEEEAFGDYGATFSSERMWHPILADGGTG